MGGVARLTICNPIRTQRIAISCARNCAQLTDLCKLVSAIRLCFANLEYLSLMGNPLCPAPLMLADFGPGPGSPARELSSGSDGSGADELSARCLHDPCADYGYQKYR